MLNKKLAVASVVLSLMSSVTFAEIVVILPQTGAMASASDSIKRGLVQANQRNGNKYNFKFVDIRGQKVADIFKKNLTKTTQMVIGPLDKANVEQLVALNPSVPALALNQIDRSAPHVYQFALSKEEDAQALTKRMQIDGINRLYVLIDPKSRAITQSFYDAMSLLWGNKMQLVSTVPNTLTPQQGVLWLGSGQWLSQQSVPKTHSYTLPYAIEEKLPLAQGLTFCDTPALYAAQWSDVLEAYRQKPVTMPFQRLLAFGGDAWQIADTMLTAKSGRIVEFKGRTGHIRMVDNVIFRQPQCFQADQGTVKILP